MMLDLREAIDLLGLSLPEEARASDIALLEFIERGFPREALSSACQPLLHLRSRVSSIGSCPNRVSLADQAPKDA